MTTTPAWAAEPVTHVPAWASSVETNSTPVWAAAQDSPEVPLSDLLAYAAAQEAAALEAAEPLQLTQGELADLLNQARADGAQEARTSLDAAILASLAALPAAISEATQGFDALLAAEAKAGAQHVVDAAVEIAAWLCGAQVERDPELIMRLAERALLESGGTSGSTVRVPESLAVTAQRWAARLGTAAPELVPDDTVVDGTVVVQRGQAQSVVSIAEALSRAADALGASVRAS